MDKPAKPIFTMSSNGSHDPLFDQFVTNNPQPAVAGCLPNCLQVANFLDQATCTFIINYIECQSFTRLQTIDFNSSKVSVSDKRITDNVAINGIEQQIIDIFNRVHRCIAEFYQCDLEWFERPQILRYGAGGRFDAHWDAGFWGHKKERFNRTYDCDYSSLIYLNEQFFGGLLSFPNLDIKIKPTRGLLVTFASADKRYLHAAEPIESGIRYALVCWAAQKGVTKVNDTPPSRSILL
ncbi:MAG: 2OG-Fe(II) oxygenase [Psychrobium sp.]|nr:2OG-Fe(II) oxygenase [Psychrobium sp.]